MTTLNDFIGFFDKVDKRIRDEKITELLPKADLLKRVDFEGDSKNAPKKIVALEKALKAIAKDRDIKVGEVAFRGRAQPVGGEASSTRRAPSTSSIGNWRPRLSIAR